MKTLYPEIEPYKHGMLDGGDNNLIYWEACGNKHGKPALVLHGGPGSGCSANMRRFFHPALYNIILFDQRGCGRSTPHAGNLTTDFRSNTTWHLLADIEKLREHLNIAKWLILGFSWGSTLGLAYTEQHPDNVSELILVGVTMTRTSEINWLYRDVAPLFPEQWIQFRAYAHKAGNKSDDLVATYYHLLHNTNQEAALEAAKAWHAWEAASLSINADAQLPPQWNEPAFLLARARIVSHYFHHQAWLEDNHLLENATKLSGIPGVMVQARLDLASPLTTAWELAQVWEDGELTLVQGAGHSSSDPGMTETIIAATDRFASI